MRKMEGKFITLMAPHHHSNRRLSTLERLSRASFREPCVVRGYADGSAFQKKNTQKCDGHTAIDSCGRLVNVYRTHHQPGMTSG
jgi:hypothetical protein